MGHSLHHQGLALDEEMIHDEQERDAACGGLGSRWLRRPRFSRSSPTRRKRRSLRSASRPSSGASTRTSPTASCRGADEGFELAGVEVPNVTHVSVPGAYELPFAAKLHATSGHFAGVACLGVVIRGETDHYDFVCAEAARGIQDVQLETGVPCAFGVITCDTMEQALARAGGGKRDQGRNAALTVARMALLKGQVNPYRWQSRDCVPSTIPMAKVCHSCGKGPAFGQSRSHSMVATKRRFDPNLQKVRIQENGRKLRAYVCTRCLKSNKVIKAA